MIIDNKTIYSLLIMSLFLLVSCGSDSKETKSKAAKEYKGSIKDTFLEGEVVGELNGTAFSFYNEDEGPGKIRESNRGSHLNLTFSTLPTLVLTVNVAAYKGADTYIGGNNFLLLSLKNPTGKFTNKDDSTLTIIEDNDTRFKGNLSFTATSASDEKFVINADFDLNKVVIDLDDQEALLVMVKKNPSVVESLGELKSDKNFMLKAMSTKILAFNYADQSLKEDREFILKALEVKRENFLLLMQVNDEIKSDKSFALKAVKVNELAINLLDKSLKTDEDVIAASKSN